MWIVRYEFEDAGRGTSPALYTVSTEKELNEALAAMLDWLPKRLRKREARKFREDLDRYGSSEVRMEALAEDLVNDGDATWEEMDQLDTMALVDVRKAPAVANPGDLLSTKGRLLAHNPDPLKAIDELDKARAGRTPAQRKADAKAQRKEAKKQALAALARNDDDDLNRLRTALVKADLYWPSEVGHVQRRSAKMQVGRRKPTTISLYVYKETDRGLPLGTVAVALRDSGSKIARLYEETGNKEAKAKTRAKLERVAKKLGLEVWAWDGVVAFVAPPPERAIDPHSVTAEVLSNLAGAIEDGHGAPDAGRTYCLGEVERQAAERLVDLGFALRFQGGTSARCVHYVATNEGLIYLEQLEAVWREERKKSSKKKKAAKKKPSTKKPSTKKPAKGKAKKTAKGRVPKALSKTVSKRKAKKPSGREMTLAEYALLLAQKNPAAGEHRNLDEMDAAASAFAQMLAAELDARGASYEMWWGLRGLEGPEIVDNTMLLPMYEMRVATCYPPGVEKLDGDDGDRILESSGLSQWLEYDGWESGSMPGSKADPNDRFGCQSGDPFEWPRNFWYELRDLQGVRPTAEHIQRHAFRSRLRDNRRLANPAPEVDVYEFSTHIDNPAQKVRRGWRHHSGRKVFYGDDGLIYVGWEGRKKADGYDAIGHSTLAVALREARKRESGERSAPSSAPKKKPKAKPKKAKPKSKKKAKKKGKAKPKKTKPMSLAEFALARGRNPHDSQVRLEHEKGLPLGETIPPEMLKALVPGVDPAVIYYSRGHERLGFYIDTDASTAAEAVKLGKRWRKSMIARTKLRWDVRSLHDLPMWVGYRGGYVELDTKGRQVNPYGGAVYNYSPMGWDNDWVAQRIDQLARDSTVVNYLDPDRQLHDALVEGLVWDASGLETGRGARALVKVKIVVNRQWLSKMMPLDAFISYNPEAMCPPKPGFFARLFGAA